MTYPSRIDGGSGIPAVNDVTTRIRESNNAGDRTSYTFTFLPGARTFRVGTGLATLQAEWDSNLEHQWWLTAPDMQPLDGRGRVYFGPGDLSIGLTIRSEVISGSSLNQNELNLGATLFAYRRSDGRVRTLDTSYSGMTPIAGSGSFGDFGGTRLTTVLSTPTAEPWVWDNDEALVLQLGGQAEVPAGVAGGDVTVEWVMLLENADDNGDYPLLTWQADPGYPDGLRVRYDLDPAEGQAEGVGGLVKRPRIPGDGTAEGLGSADRFLDLARQAAADAVGSGSVGKLVDKLADGIANGSGSILNRVRPVIQEARAAGSGVKLLTVDVAPYDVTARGTASFARQLDLSRLFPVTGEGTGIAGRIVTHVRSADGTAVGVIDPEEVKVCMPITSLAVPVEPGIDNPTREIAGVVRDNLGNPYLGGATVVLVRQSDNVGVKVRTSSTTDGSYSFPRDDGDTRDYYVVAFAEEGTGEPIQAVTERGQTPTLA